MKGRLLVNAMDYKLNYYALALGLILFLGGCVAATPKRRNLPDTIKEGDIIHLASGKKVPFSVLDKFLEFADIVYVGETHANVEAHRIQYELLKAFYSKYGSKTAIGMEMFKRSYQSVLDEWIAGRLDEKTFLKRSGWQQEWGFDFRFYRDLWNFAKEKKIPIVALNASRDLVKEISVKGLSGLSQEKKKILPKIDLSDPYHRLYLERIFAQHKQYQDRFEKFYKVQCFWEDFMAESISKYLNGPAGQGKKMIVFTGNGHIIYGFGVPKRVFGRTHLPYMSVYTYDQFNQENDSGDFNPVLSTEIPLEPADFLVAVSLKRIKEKHGVLGVSLELTPEKKVRIKKVYDGSPADKAGLKKGDIITAMGGEAVTEAFDITYSLKLKKDNDACRFSILRENTTLDIPVELFSWSFHH